MPPSTTPSRVRLTAGRVEFFACPAGKSQAFLWDTEAPSLMLRATPTGRKTYAFEGRLNGATIRVNIGTAADWSLGDARKRAAELKQLVDSGQDPRELEREAMAAKEAKRQQEQAQAVTVGEAWTAYIAERKPHWGELHIKDHERLTRAGGEPAKRGTRGRGVTNEGPLHPLLGLALRDLTAPVIEAWAAREAQTRPTTARLAWRLLRAFLAWCTEHPEYAAVVSERNPAKTKKAREALGKAKVKQDALQREQLSAWFTAVRNIGNQTVSAYLQTLLLTGARPGEVLALRWDDLNVQWHGLTIRDKVEGERTIPLTPYVQYLLTALPRRNAWVFASPTKEDAHLTEPNHAHDKACKVAGIDALTLHGLRRSFGTLSEWLEVPAGVVAQIQGHKPSATAEKHYRVRPLDLLRVHHEKIEVWMLEQAGVQFDRKTEPGKLALVKAA